MFVTLDVDGQHDPAEIPRLVKPIEDGVGEVVLGSRFMGKNEPLICRCSGNLV